MSDSIIVAIVAIIISLLSLIISLITSISNSRTKRYELAAMQRKEVLAWYNDVSKLLSVLRHEIEFTNVDNGLVAKRAQLSAFIDQGRFYFPNIVKDVNYGKEKPSAFRGHRDVALDLLVAYYNVATREDARNYIEHLNHFQRLFTSRVFDVLQPRKFNKLTRRFTPLVFSEEFSLEALLGAILASNPDQEEIDRLYAQVKTETYTTSRRKD